MTENSIHVVVPRLWVILIRIAGALLGWLAALAVQPLVNWLIRMAGDAPGPLRLAAGLPLVWAIPVLTLAGLGAGYWVASQWQKENGTISIRSDRVIVRRAGFSCQVDREVVGGVFTDGQELVVVDNATNELLRVKTDKLLQSRLRQALRAFEYPWEGTRDPREDAFVAWVDGNSEISATAHDLLRSRQRALADKRFGIADEARDRLRSLGIAVRDRGGGQQYRIVRRADR